MLLSGGLAPADDVYNFDWLVENTCNRIDSCYLMTMDAGYQLDQVDLNP